MFKLINFFFKATATEFKIKTIQTYSNSLCGFFIFEMFPPPSTGGGGNNWRLWDVIILMAVQAFRLIHGDNSMLVFPIRSECIAWSREEGGSAHSPRRTLAIWLRIKNEEGYRVSSARINDHFLWSPTSKQFFNHSRDCTLYTNWKLPTAWSV